MEEEPTLPRLAAWNSSIDPLSHHQPKKRVRLTESSPQLSSDPIFSSDDDPSADNYVQGRRKKQYRGPWYRQEAEDESEREFTRMSQRKPRTLKRQLDSGVWMGSDGTDMDFEETLPLPPPPPASQQFASRSSQKAVQVSWEDAVISHCLEEQSENIDLSSHSLTSISSESIQPLHTFIPPSDGTSFSPLVPELRVFLYQNCLTSVPGEIFKLEHLSLLSLRDNHIKELPSSIGQATKLFDLNVSSNKLRYLPYEILELFKSSSQLRMLHIHPNPFYEPEGLADTGSLTPRRPGSPRSPLPRTSNTLSGYESAKNWETTYRCSTPIRFFDIGGQLVKGPSLPDESNKTPAEEISLPSTQEPFQYPSLRGGSRPVVQLNTPPRSRSPVGNRLPLSTSRQQPPPPRGSHTSFSPSLIEAALRICYEHHHLPSLQTLASKYPDFPQHLLNLLSCAREVKESGGQECTICRRRFIVKRTEWIEWWEIRKSDDGKGAASLASPLGSIENSRDMVESLVPLIRRGCSWGCVPKEKM